jgi:hypothetical protein
VIEFAALGVATAAGIAVGAGAVIIAYLKG